MVVAADVQFVALVLAFASAVAAVFGSAATLLEEEPAFVMTSVSRDMHSLLLGCTVK